MHNVIDRPEVAALLNELTTPAGREDPYPRYERLRVIAPVVRAGDGALVVTGYADCTTVVRDHRLGQLPPDVLAMAGYRSGHRAVVQAAGRDGDGSGQGGGWQG